MLKADSELRMANQKTLTYDGVMARIAQVKNGFAPKICARCGLPFEWRKKWAKNWDEVKYCSNRCRGGS